MADVQDARAARGTKRVCDSCSIRFYDLGREPIICPACGQEHVPVMHAAYGAAADRIMGKSGSRSAAARSAAVPAKAVPIEAVDDAEDVVIEADAVEVEAVEEDGADESVLLDIDVEDEDDATELVKPGDEDEKGD